MDEEVQKALLAVADAELILGWRDSEWTGIAPFLEEDVAFSSIAQNEIGHARALYELAARDLGTTADELAFGRAPRSRAARRAHAGADGALGGDDDGAALAAGGDDVVTVEQVWAALAEIPDPELPVISVVELGVVRGVEV